MMEITPTVQDEHTPETGPRPFSEIPGLWTKIFQMSERFFSEEAPRASGSNTFIGVVIFAMGTFFISTIVSFLNFNQNPLTQTIDYGVEEPWLMPSAMTLFFFSICLGIIMVPVGFYASNGLVYLGAKVFGGVGDFTTQLYLQSLFSIPLGIILSVLSIGSVIPYAGSCFTGVVSLGGTIYSFILNIRVIKVTHHLDTARAVGAALLIPTVMVFLLGCIMVVALSALGPSIGSVFSDIMTSVP